MAKGQTTGKGYKLQANSWKLKANGCTLEVEGKMLPTSIRHPTKKLTKSTQHASSIVLNLVFGADGGRVARALGDTKQPVSIDIARSFCLGLFWDGFRRRLEVAWGTQNLPLSSDVNCAKCPTSVCRCAIHRVTREVHVAVHHLIR